MTTNAFLNTSIIPLINRTLGLHIRPQDQDILYQKLQCRLSVLKLPDLYAYGQYLAESSHVLDTGEWRELIQLLTTTESYFFRDRGQFDLLQNQILPELITRKRQEVSSIFRPSLRIWSAGCSTGEEAYSLAILVQQLIPDYFAWDILIVGTDVNQSVLQRARLGIYSNWSFRVTESQVRQLYFYPYGSDWRIHPHVQSMVVFQWGNLVTDIYPHQSTNLYSLDLILCRNVFIYFEPRAIAFVLQKFYNALNPHGYLMTGHTELQGQDKGRFQICIFPASVVYQRQPTPSFSRATSTFNVQASEPNVVLAPPCRSRVEHHSPWIASSVPPTPDPLLQSTLSTCGHHHASHAPDISKHLAEIINLMVVHKDYRTVITKAESVLREEPNNFRLYCLLAQAHANLGDYEQATYASQKAIQLDPLSEEPCYILAQIAEEQGNIEDAKTLLKRVIYLAPNSVHAYLELGALYEREGQLSKAQRIWRSAIEMLKQMPQEIPIAGQDNLTAAQLLSHLELSLHKTQNLGINPGFKSP